MADFVVSYAMANGTLFLINSSYNLKKYETPIFLEEIKQTKNILVQVSNAVFIISNDIVGSWLFPKVVVCRSLTKANHSRNHSIIILGVCTVELQTIFWIKENSIGTGVRRG